jgi:antitoxin component of MazEF toxin-antitoxin module
MNLGGLPFMNEAASVETTQTEEKKAQTPFSVRIPGSIIEQLSLKVGDRVHLDFDTDGHLILRDASGKIIARLLSQGETQRPS